MSYRVLPAILGLALAAAAWPASAQPARYLPPPPLVLSPNLTEPWVTQLLPGPRPIYAVPRARLAPRPEVAAVAPPAAATVAVARPDPRTTQLAPQFLPQEVAYDGREAPGTIVIDTNSRFLYLVEDGGLARRYGVGVGRPGFTWAGEHSITRKAEWPDWHPPVEMRQRQPNLPVMMPGGPKNPLGARAMYLGSTLYRIHGTSEPWTIGHSVSSGCIRMRNEDVTDLYGRVRVGTRVIVM
jgi:lipoprotein-anchoring transpeptidase ErfK/SrfK